MVSPLRDTRFCKDIYAVSSKNTLRHSASGGRLGIGVDYGTSNSAAAVFDGQRVTVIALEKTAKVMPSATYVNRDFQIVTGQEAIEEYVRSNTGRTVELSAEILGEGRSSTGQIGDHGLPKKRLRRSSMASPLLTVGSRVDFFAALSAS